MAPTGHIGIALAARNLESRLPLWAWIVLPFLTDIEYGIFAAAGLESQASCPWSHSLAGCVALALIAYGAFYLARRDRRIALVAGALTLSHWLEDFFVWSNLSFAPGFEPNLGLGFYDRIGFSMGNAGANLPTLFATAFEFALLASGIAVMRLTRKRESQG